jgi:hypothetical protein
MHRIIVTVLSSLAAFCFVSCTHQPTAQAPDYSKFVHIAVIDPKAAEHVGQVLERAGIRSIIVGSRGYGVSVPPGTESRATSLLRADAASQKYWIQFP